MQTVTDIHTRLSEINQTYKIISDNWVLSLARKLEGAHQQHAFFILEGIEDNKAVIWFMDLVGNPLLPNLQNAKIRIYTFSAESHNELKTTPLLYRCTRKMMDLTPNEQIACKTWYIAKEDAVNLISDIKKDKDNPPKFNILGEGSLLTGSSAYSSSTDRGHNCFTYAKEKINNLNCESVKLTCENTAYCVSHVADITSLTLKSTTQTSGCLPCFSKLVLTGGAVLGLVALGSYYGYLPKFTNK
jgi:hypothetical protein